jgi:hypothetical protein
MNGATTLLSYIHSKLAQGRLSFTFIEFKHNGTKLVVTHAVRPLSAA